MRILFRKGGKLTLTDENNIDIIIKYYPNRSIDTNDLYGILSVVQDLLSLPALPNQLQMMPLC